MAEIRVLDKHTAELIAAGEEMCIRDSTMMYRTCSSAAGTVLFVLRDSL